MSSAVKEDLQERELRIWLFRCPEYGQLHGNIKTVNKQIAEAESSSSSRRGVEGLRNR
jgi:hypothetical protein